MALTYEPIATTTLGSAASSYTFSSIPATYTDLILVGNMNIASGATATIFQVNSDTASNYSYTVLWGTGSSAGSSRASSVGYGLVDFYGYPPTASNTFNNVILHFMNYSNTTTNKTILCRANSAGTGTDATVSLYRSTSAINSIKIYNSGSVNLSSGCTFTLYGIKAA